MIELTRLNGSKVTVNALLIETVEMTPDTLITLTTGKKMRVLEKSADVAEKTRQYLRSLGIAALLPHELETEDD